MRGVVIGVVGGSGGVGASTFAAVLAVASTSSELGSSCTEAVLVDLDAMGGGIDVLLGIESVPGARWSGLRLGGGRLDPGLLADGLPRWGPVLVLAADTVAPSASAVESVLKAGRAVGNVVVDLGRSASPLRSAAATVCRLVVVVAHADVRALTAARSAVASIGDTPAGLVVRRGAVAPEEAARLVGVPLLGELCTSSVRSHHGLDAHRLPRPWVKIAAGICDGLGA